LGALSYHIVKLNVAEVRAQPGFATNVILLLISLLGMIGAWQLRMFVAF